MNLATEVATTLAKHPSLHLWGNGKARGYANDTDLATRDDDFLEPAMLTKIRDAADWFARYLVASKPNARRDASTYHWKHVYERHAGVYVPNGVFAVAASLAGLSLDWTKYNPIIHARESRQHPIVIVGLRNRAG